MLRRAAALAGAAALRTRAAAAGATAPATSNRGGRAAPALLACGPHARSFASQAAAEEGESAWRRVSVCESQFIAPDFLQRRAPSRPPSPPSPFPKTNNTDDHAPLGPDEIEMKGIRLAGVPVYLDAQVRREEG
jgi:hypothetical protein